MGASFRTPEQVLALNGCDRLTVSPALLAQLQQNEGPVPAPLAYAGQVQPKPAAMSEAEFYWRITRIRWQLRSSPKVFVCLPPIKTVLRLYSVSIFNRQTPSGKTMLPAAERPVITTAGIPAPAGEPPLPPRPDLREQR
ncbi:Transaldolase B [Raoultella terrigena]|uniref:Transaldolase B n=1 Tax=Raoultella terrigena TaxID=577 RepID=A0A3P8KJW3_RAOTE|nr:Transaldolase B [Raoultella terrigena]